VAARRRVWTSRRRQGLRSRPTRPRCRPWRRRVSTA
jgi:hypothetical protein